MQSLSSRIALLVVHCLFATTYSTETAPERSLAAAARLQSDLRVIVRYTDTMVGSASKTRAKADQLKGRIGVSHVKPLVSVGMAVVSCDSQEALEVLIRDLSEDSAVDLAVPDTLVWTYDANYELYQLSELELILNGTDSDNGTEILVSTTTTTTKFPTRLPLDPLFDRLWGLPDIDAPGAWNSFTGNGSEIVVAVIDTGIDYNHEDLKERMWRNPGEIPGNGIDDDGNGFIDDVYGANFVDNHGNPLDDNVHGTHCAGTIAGAGSNGIGVTGVSWAGVKLMALKFLDRGGSGRTSDAISAVDYAVAHGAKITSNSWGGGGSSSAMRVAIERAEVAGLLFIAAAGNSATDNDYRPQYPANYPVDTVVSVASTQEDGQLSSFSCYGEQTVHVAAPGSHILSTAPGNTYKSLSGTSMATPHVSGLAALVWMYRPHLTPLQIKEILLSTATRSEALEGRIITGGKINARLALDAAETYKAPQPPVHPPLAITFKDMDGTKGSISGDVIVNAAADESDVDYYKIYFVSAAGYPLMAVGEIKAVGASSLNLSINSTSLPRYATGLMAVTGNATGEMMPWRERSGLIVDIKDYVLPVYQPQAMSWVDGENCTAGDVSGKLRITRAIDEDTISSYNIYWINQSSDNVRGPLLGTIPAIGFRRPTCAGWTCESVEQTELPGGVFKYSRADYGNNEFAAISFSGPAQVKVTHLATEYRYDTLKVGKSLLSGSLSDFQIDLPKGIHQISWQADGSLTGAGWSFELTQSNSTADFEVSTSTVLGHSVEVVSAYDDSESAVGLSANISKCKGQAMHTRLRGAKHETEEVAGSDESVSPQPEGLRSQSPLLMPNVELKAKQAAFDSRGVLGHVVASVAVTASSGVVKALSQNDVAMEAVSRSVAAALEEQQASVNVSVLRAETLEDASASAISLETIRFHFEVAPLFPSYRSGAVLDAVEARLILVGMTGGQAAQLFKASLTSELASVAPSESELSISFGPALQLFPVLPRKHN